MSCCRGRGGGRTRAPSSQHPECRDLDDHGAGLRLFPIHTATGLHLAVRTARHGLVDVASYTTALKCQGAVAGLLRRYAGDLQRLATSSPARFSAYIGPGLSLNDAISMLR